MLTTTVTTLTNILPALATLAAPATKTRRLGKRVRMYRSSTIVQATAQTLEAIRTLLGAGYAVKVYEGTTVWSPTIADDGVLVWNDRKSRRDRGAAGYSVVEVAL